MISKYISISNLNLNESIGLDIEDVINEFKEFFKQKPLTMNEINLLKKGIINDKLNIEIYNTVLHYFDKFFLKYLISMTNIDKNYLCSIENKHLSNFYIGISDNGCITGIPININQIDNLMIDITAKMYDYYNNLIGLHMTKNKGIKMIVGGKTYYNYNKIIDILKNNTKIEIIKINKTNKKNIVCENYLNYINDVLNEEKQYLLKLNTYRALINKKIIYNDSYTGPFYKLIRNIDIMKNYREYCSLDNTIFDDILNLLKAKIIIQSDVNNYLENGKYIHNSIYSTDKNKDESLSYNINVFLEEYNIFKKIELKKQIQTKKFKGKNPKKKLKSISNNISCFNEYLFNNKDIIYIIIKISWPFVKDKNLYVGYNHNNQVKILERTYEKKMNMPCSISI